MFANLPRFCSKYVHRHSTRFCWLGLRFVVCDRLRLIVAIVAPCTPKVDLTLNEEEEGGEQEEEEEGLGTTAMLSVHVCLVSLVAD